MGGMLRDRCYSHIYSQVLTRETRESQREHFMTITFNNAKNNSFGMNTLKSCLVTSDESRNFFILNVVKV
jgi:hypothetical protein